jgi:hypothetical protein
MRLKAAEGAAEPTELNELDQLVDSSGDNFVIAGVQVCERSVACISFNCTSSTALDLTILPMRALPLSEFAADGVACARGDL